MTRIILLLALTMATIGHASARFPFPRNTPYKYGILPEGANASFLQKTYETWLSLYYTESGDLARIRKDFDTSSTTSAGIGHAMLLMVYMDNASNQTQSKFDNLWRYYQKFMNPNGLMSWNVSGFKLATSNVSETPADMNVAVALLMASKQWGNGSSDPYFTGAKTLISRIRTYEISGNGASMPGDGWGDNWTSYYYPGYFTPAAIRLFEKASDAEWLPALDSNYAIIRRNVAQSTASLPSDKCALPDCSQDGSYGYEASQLPWALAISYAWFGDSAAMKLNDSMLIGLQRAGVYPARIVDGHFSSGWPSGTTKTAWFTGPLTAAGMIGPKYQSWINEGWNWLATSSDTTYNYCHLTQKLLSGLLLSSNFNNLWEYPNPRPSYPVTTSATNGVILLSPTSDSGKYDSGSTITATAIPVQGYKFTGWTGASCATTVCTFQLDSAINLTALFEAKTVGLHSRLPQNERLALSSRSLAFDPTGFGKTRLIMTDLQGKSQILWQGEAEMPQEITLQSTHSGLYVARIQGSNRTYSKLIHVME